MNKEVLLSDSNMVLLSVPFIRNTEQEELLLQADVGSSLYEAFCFKCQSFNNALVSSSTYLSGNVILNGHIIKTEEKKGYCCPNCKNESIFIGQDEMLRDVIVESQNDKMMIRAELFHIDLLKKTDSINGSELRPISRIREIFSHLKDAGVENIPFYMNEVEGSRYGGLFNTPLRYEFIVDRATNKFTLVRHIKGGESVNYSSQYLFDKEDAGAQFMHKAFVKLPKEVQRMMMEFLFENINEKVLAYKSFDLDNITSSTFTHIIALSQIPQFGMFAGNINMGLMNFSDEHIEKISRSKNNLEICRIFLPNIGKKSAHLLNQLFPVEIAKSNKSDVKGISYMYTTNVLAMINNSNTLHNLLQHFAEIGNKVMLSKDVEQVEYMFSIRKTYGAEDLRKQLYTYLDEYALDNYINNILSGKAFKNEGIDGQKRAVRTIEQLKKEGIARALDTVNDLRNDLFTIESGLTHFKKIMKQTDLSEDDLNFYQEQLLILQELNQAIEEKGKFNSVLQLHKFTSSITRRYIRENTQYDYSSYVASLAWEQGDIQVVLPKDTVGLVEVAERFDNCVANYDYEISMDEHVIAEFKVNGLSKLCLGMTTSGVIFEVKKRSNQLLDQSMAEDKAVIDALKLYIDKKELEIETEDLQYTSIISTNNFGNWNPEQHAM